MKTNELLPLGVRVSFDASALVLSIDVDPASMATSTIGVLGAVPEDKGETRIRNAPFAATLGTSLEFDPSYTWVTGSRSYSYDATLDLSPSIRAFGIVAEGDANLSYGQYGYSGSLNAARALKDFPRLGARLEAGTVDVSATSFQAGQELYGISFARDDSLPGAARELGSLADAFILEHNAYVTVEVNGVVTKQLGSLQGATISPISPLSSGLNDVSVVIEEQGMPRRVVKLGVPFDESLLGPGKVDYAIALGSVNGDRPQPYGAGRAAIGIGRYFQFGIDAEAGYGSVLGGLSTLAATPLGTVGLDGAVSFGFPGTTAASAPSYAARAYWRFSRLSSRYAPLLGANAEYRAPGFVPPSATAPTETGTLSLSGQIGENLPGIPGSVSLFGQASLVESVLDSWSGTFGITLPFGRFFFLSLAGGSDWSAESGLLPRVTLTLTATRPDKGQLSYNQTFAGGSDSEALSVGLDEQGRSSVNVGGDGLFSEGANRDLELSGITRTNGAVFAGSGRYFRSADGGTNGLSGSLSASSTLAFAEGMLAATSSPSNALAILIPSPELQGQLVELSPTSGVPATSNSGKPVVVSGLIPYTDYVDRVELPQSPPDARPSPASIELSPEYRSITVIHVGVAPSISVRGALVNAENAPVANMPGDLVDANGAIIPFSGTFTDEKGVFECYGLSPGPVAIRWGDGSVLSFQVPESRPNSMVDLGIVTAIPGPVGGNQ